MHQTTIRLTLSLIILISVTACDKSQKLPFGIRDYSIGTAENFKLQNLDDETFELKNTKGHWVFLHFWASWCGPCREEMPTIQKMSELIIPKKMQIILVNTAEDEDTIFAYLSEINIELDSLLDKDGIVTEHWKPRGLPTSFLINPEGKVMYQAVGGRQWQQKEYIDFINQL